MGEIMKRSKFTETQIMAILKLAEQGIKVMDICLRTWHQQRDLLSMEKQIRWLGSVGLKTVAKHRGRKCPTKKCTLN